MASSLPRAFPRTTEGERLSEGSRDFEASVRALAQHPPPDADAGAGAGAGRVSSDRGEDEGEDDSGAEDGRAEPLPFWQSSRKRGRGRDARGRAKKGRRTASALASPPAASDAQSGGRVPAGVTVETQIPVRVRVEALVAEGLTANRIVGLIGCTPRYAQAVHAACRARPRFVDSRRKVSFTGRIWLSRLAVMRPNWSLARIGEAASRSGIIAPGEHLSKAFLSKMLKMCGFARSPRAWAPVEEVGGRALDRDWHRGHAMFLPCPQDDDSDDDDDDGDGDGDEEEEREEDGGDGHDHDGGGGGEPAAAAKEKEKASGRSKRDEEIRRRLQEEQRRRCAEGRSLLDAATWGREAAVRELLSGDGGGVDPNDPAERTAEGASALMLATVVQNRQRRLAVVSALLDGGADPNHRDSSERTPLMWACQVKAAGDAVSLLLRAGATAGLADAAGTTALLEAARMCDADTVRRLVEAGASRSAADRDGFTPLMLAASGTRHADKVVAILAGGGPAALDARLPGNQQTAAMMAADSGNVAAVEALLEAGADLTLTDSEGWTAAHFAADRGDPRCLSAIARAAPGVLAARDRLAGRTPLMVAASAGRLDSLDALLAAGSSAGARDDAGRTAVSLAAGKGRTKTVARLLAAPGGADVCATPDLAGRTPLMWAAAAGRPATVAAVLAAGVPASAADAEGCTALMVAARHGHEAVVRALAARREPAGGGGAWPRTRVCEETALHVACEGGHSGVAAFLMDEGLPAGVTDRFGSTPLLRAAAGLHAGTVELLLARGADASAANMWGETAARLAAASRASDPASREARARVLKLLGAE